MATNKGEFQEELTTERREKWIKAISTESKDFLINSKHFVSRNPAPYWLKHDVDWVPTLQLCNLDPDANVAKVKRAKKGDQLAVERQEREAVEKLRKLLESSIPVAKIDLIQPSASNEEEGNQTEENEEGFSSDLAAIAVSEGEELEPETDKDSECETIEIEYMFQTSRYQTSNKDFFDTDDKVHFYTGLASI